MSGRRVNYLSSNHRHDCGYYAVRTVADQAVISGLTEAQVKEDYSLEVTFEQYLKFAWRVKRWRFTGAGNFWYGAETGEIDFSIPVEARRFQVLKQSDVDDMPEKLNRVTMRSEAEIVGAARDGKEVTAAGKPQLQTFEVPVEVHDPALPSRPIPASTRRIKNFGMAQPMIGLSLPLSTSINDDVATILKDSFVYFTVKGARRGQPDGIIEAMGVLAQAGGDRIVGDPMTFAGLAADANDIPGYDTTGTYYLAANGAVTRTPSGNRIPVGAARHVEPPESVSTQDFWHTIYGQAMWYQGSEFFDAVYDPSTGKIRMKINLTGGPIGVAGNAKLGFANVFPANHIHPAASCYGPVGDLTINLDADTELTLPLYTEAGPGGTSEATIWLRTGGAGSIVKATGTPIVIMDMQLDVEKYWTFKNKDGNPVYDENTGAQLNPA
jgi:hypothetical protein